MSSESSEHFLLQPILPRGNRREPYASYAAASDMEIPSFLPSEIGDVNSNITASAVFTTFNSSRRSSIRTDLAAGPVLSRWNTSLPEAQVTDNVRPARLMEPYPEAVTHGAQKSPATAGEISIQLLGRSGLKPVAASIVDQLLIARE